MLADRIIAGLLAFALAWFPPLAFAQSQILGFPPGVFQNRAAIDAAPVSYTGPGDTVNGAVAWWSILQCYNRAFSGLTADITDSATGNTTGTRLQCASGIVTALVSGSACTFVTGNACSTLATTCATACNVLTAYDQSGALACTGSTACDATQATNANRPTLTLSAFDGRACISWSTNSNTIALLTPSLTEAQPVTFVALAERTANFTTAGAMIQVNGTGLPRMAYRTSVNSAAITAGTQINSTTATDSAFHAFIGIFNSSSSNIVVDGTAATAGSAGASTLNAGINIGGNGAFASYVGYFCEGGIWAGTNGAFSSTQYGNMNTNVHSRWSF